MSLSKVKANYVNENVQIIAIDEKGVISSSDDVLFPFKKNQKIEDAHPFFYSLLPLLAESNTEVFFPCINLQIGEVKKIVDINILKQEGELYLVLIDFTNHYENSQPLVQEKNESVIAGNKLLFEQELLFAKEDFKNSFLAHLNHEIRNPLNALLGFTELLGETNLTFQQKETLGVLQKTGMHIKVLMDDLLDISRIETGVLEIKEVPFNLHSVIASMSKHFQIKKKNQNIELSYETDGDVPAKLFGDPTRVNQVLYNLFDNAYRNTKEGSIVLHTSLKELSKDAVATIVFKISDTGHGISKKQIDTIFDSYIQLEIDKEKPLGDSLGLKIVKELTQLLGGKVDVKSEINKGSDFIVTIPFKTREKTSKRKTIPKGSGIVMSKRVLAVEDESLNQMLLMKQFIDNDKGYALQIAPDTETAIQMLDKKKYLALIIKQTYKTTTGIHFVETLKSNPAHKNIPILVVSSKAMMKEQDAILKAGASAFLKKPYSKHELFTALQKL